jgi:hypothetical protein
LPKLTLNDPSNLTSSSAASTIAANNRAIEAALENTLSRNGATPNDMDADLDMDSNRILNLPAAVGDTEPVRKLELDTATDAMDATVATAVGTVAAYAAQTAADAAIAAASAARLQATSVTSITIGTGPKVFITQSDKYFPTGAWVLVRPDSDITKYMHGYVVSYVGTILTLQITNIDGAGTFTDWGLLVSGTQGAPTGVTTAFGRSGTVVAVAGDYTADKITNTPAGGVAATNVQTAINELDTEKAPLASPALTGTPTAPTAAPGTNTTQISTTAFVKAAIDVVLGGVASAFDTLSEIVTELALKAYASVVLTAGAGLTGGGDLSANRSFAVGAGTGITVNADDVAINYNNANVWLASQTFINASGIKIQDTDASHTLGLVGGSNLTANRTLTFTTGDASRVVTLNGDTTLSGTNTGDQTITLTGDVTGTGTGSFAATIAAGVVTYAKIQNVSATDKVLGRSTAGAGSVEEIACTSAGRALIDDADAAAQRTTLGLGTAAIKNTGTSGNNIPLLDGATTWSGVHTVAAKLDAQQDWYITGDISPAQITANQNDYNPTGLSTATVLRLNTDASHNITGLAGGADGRMIYVHNVGAQNIVLVDESASSTAANRFALSGDATIQADQSVLLQYDSTSTRWRLIGSTSSGGAGGAPTTADYLVKTADATLSAERVVTDTSTVTVDWATAGQAKFNAVGALVSSTAYTSTQTITIPAGATKAVIYLWGGAGGGGGAKSNESMGGPGAGAGALVKTLTGLTAGNTLALTVGAAGAAGATTPGNGGAGGNSTLASGTQTITTLTANGGGGGGLASGAGAVGAAATGGSATNGDFNFSGTNSVPVASTSVAGVQGSTGMGFGLGGAPGHSTSATGVAGTAGTIGGCLIEWYT